MASSAYKIAYFFSLVSSRNAHILYIYIDQHKFTSDHDNRLWILEDYCY